MEPDLKLVLTKTKQPDKYSTYWDSHSDSEGSESTTIEIWVWHQVLCNVSLFFRALLAPERFLEGVDFHQNKKNVLEIRDTNAEAMKILCDIFHHRTDTVPRQLTSHQLFHVSVLADKFDCVDSLRMWIPIWMDQETLHREREVMMDKEIIPLVSRWLCIHFNLRYAGTVKDLRNAFIVYSLGFERDRRFNPFIDHLKQSFMEEAEKDRLSAVKLLHKLMKYAAFVAQYHDQCQLSSSAESTTRPGSIQQDEDPQLIYRCHSIRLGSFIIFSGEVFGPSWETSDVWEWSIQDIINHLRRFANKMDGPLWLVRTDYRRDGVPIVDPHAECSSKRGMLEGIETLMNRRGIITRETRSTDPKVFQPEPWSARYEPLCSNQD